MPTPPPALGPQHRSHRRARLSASHLAWLSITAFSLVSAALVRPAEERTGSLSATDRAPLANVEAKAAALAATLAADCPAATAGHTTSFEACRRHLYLSPALRQSLGDVVLWGRRNRDGPARLADSDLAQLSPSLLAGTYLPLLVYDGRSHVAWSGSDGLWRIEVGARPRDLRDADAPPSPLRREDQLEADLEGTEAVLLWLERDARTIFAVQTVAAAAPLPAPAAIAGARLRSAR